MRSSLIGGAGAGNRGLVFSTTSFYRRYFEFRCSFLNIWKNPKMSRKKSNRSTLFTRSHSIECSRRNILRELHTRTEIEMSWYTGDIVKLWASDTIFKKSKSSEDVLPPIKKDLRPITIPFGHNYTMFYHDKKVGNSGIQLFQRSRMVFLEVGMCFFALRNWCFLRHISKKSLRKKKTILAKKMRCWVGKKWNFATAIQIHVSTVSTLWGWF